VRCLELRLDSFADYRRSHPQIALLRARTH
jgi:hypothetical protein